MRRRLTGFTKLGAVVFLLAALTFAGCSDNSVLGPQENETSHLDRSAAQSGGGDLTIASIGELETAKVIYARTGGVVPIHREDYHHAFVVKPLALNKSKLITVKSNKEEVNGKSALTLEFGPAGLVFDEASDLKVDMSEINPNAKNAKLYYYDPAVGDWVLYGESPVRRGVATFDIHHFSKYAISD
ncbi:MAG: hypothetical protein GY839_15040 [candidate division Zixibacteria bacterium]|nr:hypothetical protein [candidate division Zixibacteria bacterium]